MLVIAWQIELVEGDNLIETVQKFWSKLLGQMLLNDATSILLILFVDRHSVAARFRLH